MPDDKYEDTGCHLAPSCLACPFPVCYLDEITEKKHIKPEEVQRTRTFATPESGIGVRGFRLGGRILAKEVEGR